MSPSQDLRDGVSHATPPPDTKVRVSSASLFPKCQEQCTATVTQIHKELPHPRPGYCSSYPDGPVEGGGPKGTNDREVTLPPLTKEQIEGHESALNSLIKYHNQGNKTYPIDLDFKLEDTEVHEQGIVKGNEVIDGDLKKPFKETRKTPLIRRIIEFAGPEYKMPANIKLYDGTIDPEDHLSRFANAANSGEWPMPVWFRMFQQTLDGSAQGWFERLPRNSINKWTDLREAFVARYSVRRACFREPHEITKIVRKPNESLTTFKERWTVETGFIKDVSEVMKISSFMDAVKSPELAKHFSNKVPLTMNEMMERLDDFVRSEEAYVNTELPKEERPKEILATERQLRLPAPRPMLNPLGTGNTDRGRGAHSRDAPQPTKIINVINVNSVKDKKRKVREVTEGWINVPISFPPISSEDISDEPLIIEAEVEGYLVKQVYVDEGSSVEVMFEHGFENLDARINAKVKETQTDLVGFAGEISKPLGKIELEVCFRNGGLCRRTSMKFIVVRAPSPYNIILGRLGLKTLRAIPSTIYSMMKFPTPKGVATLVTRIIIIVECRSLEKKQMIEEEGLEGEKEVSMTEVLVNPFFSKPNDATIKYRHGYAVSSLMDTAYWSSE
ncbi:reverse transcriptase domain-containing protein [Tanacetum coccineum]